MDCESPPRVGRRVGRISPRAAGSQRIERVGAGGIGQSSGALLRAAPIQALVAERLRDPNASLECRRIVLRAIAQSGLKETPVAWTAALCHVLVAGNADLVAEAVSAARALPAPKVKPEELVAGLMKIGNDAGLPVTVRLNALAAVPGGLVAVPPSLFAFLRARLDPEEPVVHRGLSADVLSRAKLSSEQLVSLAESLKVVGPMELDRLLETFAQSSDERVGLSLVSALKASLARSALRGTRSSAAWQSSGRRFSAQRTSCMPA